MLLTKISLHVRRQRVKKRSVSWLSLEEMKTGLSDLSTPMCLYSETKKISMLIAIKTILAIPAFVGWILPYFIFKRVQNNKTKKYAPLIEERYDAIYNISKQANALLA